jgi:ATPase family associated with various cellular activities (AAA)/Winged helix domain, variant
MNDALLAPQRPPAAAPPFAPAQRLSREVAALAARLARLLGGLAISTDGPIESGRAFLEAMVQTWWPGEPSAPFAGNALERRPAGALQPLDRLATGLGLSAVEVDLLLLAAMPEEHEGYASVLRTLNPRGEGRAAVGLAAQLLCRNAEERLGLREQLLSGSAMREGLVSLSGDGGLYEQNLVLAPGLWPVLGGIDHWPADIRPIALNPAPAGLEDWFADAQVQRALRALKQRLTRAVVVSADTEDLAADRAAALCLRAGVEAVGFGWSASAPAAGACLARAHALARGVVPVFRVADGGVPPPLTDTARHPGVVILAARRGASLALGELPVIHLAVEALSASARIRMWRSTLPELAAEAPTLALRYPVDPATAERTARDARSLAALADTAVDLDQVAESVRARAHAHLTPGLNVVRPTARWDQLVLPPDRKAQLAEALHRLEHQAIVLDRWRFLEGRSGARGVRMLLCGPPGTGKSLSAEVLANTLGVDLLVVDIARLVSKWIGETEKHLAAVFDAAERSQSVLLFDEADALFGRRTEVSDAHDRYANLETAYLLSRLERFEGLAMLSTNLKQNIDPAFLRRLEFVVEFDLPGTAERAAMWRCHLPPQAPLAADVDLQQLAAVYPITGGLIRNASVAAAYRAAVAGTPITPAHLIAAIAREYEKAGKAFPGVPAGLPPT